jgi:hypothetical protein
VNATNVLLTRRVHESLVGADVVARAIASLPRETAEAWENAGTVGWVPVACVDDVTRAVAAHAPGWTPERLGAESARRSVEMLMKTLWRIMLRFTSDEALVARTPLLYSKTFNVGRLESAFPRPGVAEVVHAGWPEITDLQVIGLANGIEAVLDCAGRASPKVVWRRTASGVLFLASWSR